MEPVVIARGDAPRTASRGRVGDRSIRAGNRILGLMALAGAVGSASLAVAQGHSSQGASGGGGAPSSIALSGDVVRPSHRVTSPSRGLSTPAVDSPDPPASSPVAEEAERYRIRGDAGKCVVARLHGRYGGRAALMQPDGQIGFPNMLVPTTDPFVPVAADELRQNLEKGPYAGFEVLSTPHYLIFYRSRLAFAKDSAKLLEDLYRGLVDFCRRNDLPAHESEFPLVAVIFATESDFRAHKQVDPDVQAYYEIFTNRIFFYEESERDRNEPKLVALRKPQTVAHEGAHQILANIGIQPRLSAWPLWLIEGFTEFCATPLRTKKGLTWPRLGWINPLHMATLRELDDPLSNELLDDEPRAKASVRPSRILDSEALITKARLTPTDYAQSWALTHYLALERPREFARYLRSMGRMPPLDPRTPEEHLAEFRKSFGDDLAKLDKKVEDYIRKLIQKGNFLPLPYYAVIVEQPLGNGMVRRRAWISQSPQMIQRWVEQNLSHQGGVYNWEAVPFPTRARAELARDNWIRGF